MRGVLVQGTKQFSENQPDVGLGVSGSGIRCGNSDIGQDQEGRVETEAPEGEETPQGENEEHHEVRSKQEDEGK